jgi:hypothetical protein
MAAPSLSKQIGETEGRIGQLVERMEAARGEIVAATATFAAGWWEDEARRALWHDRRRGGSLGDEGLRHLRTEVRGLVESADSVAEAGLADPALWPHQGAYEARPWHDPRFETEEYAGVGRALEPAMRRILSRVLPVLGRHGLRFPDRRGRPVTDRYPQYVEYSDEVCGAARAYYGLAAELRPAVRRLRELQGENEYAEIEALWKKA